MKLRLMLLCALATSATLPQGAAQTATPPSGAVKTPVYDVVSIKPNKTGSGNVSISIDDGNYEATNVSLKDLILNAYDLKDSQIAELPAWAKSARFDIKAKVVEPDKEVFKKLTDDQFREMLRPILIERFQLTFHYETKVLPVYELVMTKDGPKFKTSAVTDGDGKTVDGMGAGSMRVHNTELTAVGIAMKQLAFTLSGSVGRIVVDKTGLPGKYDMHLKWSRDDGPPADADAVPGLFTALQEQLGLKLEGGKASVPVFITERVLPPVED